MAEGNRQRVERAYAGFQAGSEAEFLALLHPDAEWRWPLGVAGAEVYRGVEEIRTGVREWTESWSDFHMELLELLERDDDVLAVVTYRVRAPLSGLDVDAVVAHLWQFEDDLAVRLRMFGNVEKAKAQFLG
jgi:ketosteroid isomerase-like protein